MKAVFALLLSFTSVNAWAGGELPFPFDQEAQMQVVQDHTWAVVTTNLSVQLKVYLDPRDAALEWVRIWIRGDDGFVWNRILMQRSGNEVHAGFVLDEAQGEVALDLQNSNAGDFILGDQHYRLVLRK